MMKSRGKLTGKFYLVSLVLIVFVLILAGCDSSSVGDLDPDNGTVADSDLDAAKIFAQNLSDHSINLMELGTAQAENLEEGMMDHVAPYAEATFYRMIWIAEIMDMWDAKMDEPGVYEVDFQKDQNNYKELSKESNSINHWSFKITNFYDDPEGDKNIKHVVAIESNPDSYTKQEKADKDEDGYKVYEINLADVEFKYTHERKVDDQEDTDFDWSFDFTLSGDESEPILVYEDEYHIEDKERYYYILPINPSYNLVGTLKDDLLIEDNSSSNVKALNDNNNNQTPPKLGSININSSLETNTEDKQITIDGNITAEEDSRQTVTFNGETTINYNELTFEDENVVIDLIDFDSSSTFRVENYFEIAGGLKIDFSEIIIELESYLSLTAPKKIILEGSYKDLTEDNGMELNGDITVEFLNIEEFDFIAGETEDNYPQIRVSINGNMSSELDPVSLNLTIDRTGYEEVTIDPLNYQFADGSSMEGSGLIGPGKLQLTAWCNRDVLMYLDIVFDEMDPEDYKLGEVRDSDNNVIADIVFDNHEMIFEFIDGEPIAMFPSDD